MDTFEPVSKQDTSVGELEIKATTDMLQKAVIVANEQFDNINVYNDLHNNIYTNDQPIHANTRSFIYVDDLCIASQGTDFNNIEASLTSALSTMTTYYDTNQLRANPSKTQVCAFHLRNREAKRELNVVWNGTRHSNTTTPVYLGIHLDRTLC